VRVLQSLLFMVFLTGAIHRVCGFESSYRVWHRAIPLTPDEVNELARQHVTRLYWEVGETALVDGRWNWKSTGSA
jgi:hypothetical protein